jgi:hypothetical protein
MLPRRLAVLAHSVLLASALAVGTGCGGDRKTPATATSPGAVDIGLQGSWRLLSYTSEIPLEPMLAAWLAGEREQLVVRFERGYVYADSPNVEYRGTYSIRPLGGARFVIETTNPSNATYRSTATFLDGGQRLEFFAETEPFRGRGVLERMPSR